jgi:glycosyltransferase involved in cell wall biosynthesis
MDPQVAPPAIAYLIGRYPTASETFVYSEIAALRDAGASVHAWTLESRDGPEHGILPDGLVRAVPRSRWGQRVAPVPAPLETEWAELGGRPKDLRRAAWWARRLGEDGVGVVHAHFLGQAAAVASAACRMADIPLVVTVHARGIHVPTPLGLWTLLGAARAIAISRDGARACLERAGVDPVVLPLAIEPAEPAPPSGSGHLHVLTVARPAPKKGFATLREAFAGLEHPFRWTVVGASAEEIGGPMPGLDARGVLGRPGLQALYDTGVDVLALPCRVAPDGDRDGVPVALMEAMARGVAVVTTPVGGIGELVEDGRTGLLIPPDDPIALREAITRLAVDEELRRRLGRAGREHVRATRRGAPRTVELKRLLTDLSG